MLIVVFGSWSRIWIGFFVSGLSEKKILFHAVKKLSKLALHDWTGQ